MSLIISKLVVIKQLIYIQRMHNLYAIFAKFLDICKQIAGKLVNELGNVPRRGVVPKLSDLEVVALNMTSEAIGIDSESLLFAKLKEYRISYLVGNTMIDVRLLRPYVIQSGKG